MSITSRSNRPSRYSPQIACRFLIASVERGVMPVTYSRRTYRSRAGAARSAVAGRSPGSDGRPSSGSDTKIQSNQDAFRIREIADDLLDRFGQPSDEGREGENLVALGELWILHQVDHFNRVPAVEVLFADQPQIREGEN